MNISVVVPTFNRRELVLRTVESLFAQDLADEFEIVVVIDGSTDGTDAALKALSPKRRLRVLEQENRGPAAARNAGCLAATTDLVLFVDDDMLCGPTLVAAHLAAHRSSGRIIAFGAIFLSPDSPPGLAAECFNREIGAFHLEHRRDGRARWPEPDCVFSNTSIPRSLVIAAGGFDESFRMREDLELGIRLFGAGVRPVYLGGAIAYQHYAKTAADLVRDAEIFAEGDVLFALKHPDIQVPGQLTWLAAQPRWKQWLRRIAASAPSVADAFLVPLCVMGERFFGLRILRNIGVRALQMRRRIHWLHRVRMLCGRSLIPGDLRR